VEGLESLGRVLAGVSKYDVGAAGMLIHKLCHIVDMTIYDNPATLPRAVFFNLRPARQVYQEAESWE
jgi:hypothetical protein